MDEMCEDLRMVILVGCSHSVLQTKNLQIHTASVNTVKVES